MYLSSQLEGNQLTLRLADQWSAATLGDIAREMSDLPLAAAKTLLIDVSAVSSMDPSGAWQLYQLTRQVTGKQHEIRFVPAKPALLALVEQSLKDSAASGDAPQAAALDQPRDDVPVAKFGKRILKGSQSLLAGLAFVGRISAMLWRALLNPRRWRPISIARHVYDTGITAIPIVALIGFLISVIIAYMGAQQLIQFGADIFVVDLVTVGVLREMGVLLTAIIVAGRSGSAFAAEIGAMKLNEEVDALKATGVDAIEVLVLPRVMGLVIALPLLTVIADAVGMFGGALLCRSLLDMPFVQYVERMDSAIGPFTFWAGLVKAPVFAVLIAAAGTYRGMQVRSSSRELGRLTTMAVVQAIFLVILADALFAVFFMELDL